MPRVTDREAGTPTVSVLIPAYNAAPFIERAIRSALEQTHRVAEVIVVDDASTDATVDVVEDIRRRDDRVKLLRLPTNGGPAKARNAGFDAATSEWIAVLDADDAYLPGRISHLMSRSGDADMLADNLLAYDPVKDAASPYPGPSQYLWEQIDLLMFAEARRKHEDFGLFKPMFRRSFLEQHKLRYPEDVRHGEDYLMAFEAIARGGRYWLSWRPGYLYTRRSAGWSRTQVDYAAMGSHVDALASRQDLDLSPAVRAKLTKRIALIQKLQALEQVKYAYRSGKLPRAIMLAASRPSTWGVALGKAMRELMGR